LQEEFNSVLFSGHEVENGHFLLNRQAPFALPMCWRILPERDSVSRSAWRGLKCCGSQTRAPQGKEPFTQRKNARNFLLEFSEQNCASLRIDAGRVDQQAGRLFHPSPFAFFVSIRGSPSVFHPCSSVAKPHP
jgi:hypothetical protein